MEKTAAQVHKVLKVAQVHKAHKVLQVPQALQVNPVSKLQVVSSATGSDPMMNSTEKTTISVIRDSEKTTNSLSARIMKTIF